VDGIPIPKLLSNIFTPTFVTTTCCFISAFSCGLREAVTSILSILRRYGEMRALLLLTLAMFLSGCGATTQITEVRETTKEQSRRCQLDIAYNCPQPVIGKPYSCMPTVTEECAPE
jgi:hypothetical protein